ncbi:MAG: aminotransferase class I/II-fold pyridoxal phosphate-dependent enzyme [Candidatus Latescibacteria bacterium]|nr:aminotransferase class I/II-fold pyridoxal phosphate-dependent enzyme [Candidatus Latescibacterota bacterium]
MHIPPFAMERWQSTYEHQVSYNLAESGVHQLTVEELLELPGDGTPLMGEDLLQIGLGYAQGNGAAELREFISAIYPSSSIDNVLVTHGGAEANFLSTWQLLETGDEAIVMLPNYMQTNGLVEGWGATVKPWMLHEENGWQPDSAELEEAVTGKTKLIIITNPNNPTGLTFGASLLESVVAAAERVGAWILADEIYRGAEVDGPETPSFWGRYDRLLVTSGLSKAYGLPGLRIGWVVCPSTEKIEELWSYHDYSSIGSSTLTEALAIHALEPSRRQNILERTKSILRTNLPMLKEWVDRQEGTFQYVEPQAGAIMWVRYNLDVNSSDLAERVRVKEDTLIQPGDHFGFDHYLRLGYGPEHDYLIEGLARVKRVLENY